jgi:hypothetical protein
MPYAACPVGDPGQVVERDEQLWEERRERVHALFANADLQVDFAGVAGSRRRTLLTRLRSVRPS